MEEFPPEELSDDIPHALSPAGQQENPPTPPHAAHPPTQDAAEADEFPLLTPHLTLPPSPRTTDGDLRVLVRYLEESRLAMEAQHRREEAERRQEEARREEIRREEEARREAIRRQEDAQRREEENQRFQLFFQQFLQLFAPVTQGSTGQVHQRSDTETSSHPPTHVSATPQKASTQAPQPLKSDVTFQNFRAWRRCWDDYAVMVDLSALSLPKQLIQLRMCLSLETQRLLEHTLGVPPSTTRTVEEVLNVLQNHFKTQRNEALRRRDLLTCKQKDGESFDDYYVRLQSIAEEVDICPGKSNDCKETQLKMVLLMGVRDEELTQKIIALDSTTPLQAVVNVCRAHEATRTATSAIRAPTASIAKISKYRQDKGRNHQPTLTPSNTSKACQSCNKSHNSAKCPAATSTCKNCGRKGHWARTPKCPALKVTCHYCTKTGHYDKCCRKKTGDTKADKSNATPPSSTTTNVRKVQAHSNPSPSPVPVTVSYQNTSHQISFIPDTGAEVSVLGPQHLAHLQIDRKDLLPPTTSKTFTADGSEMSPPLGSLEVTLTLAKRSCQARLQVHDGVTTPLLSFSHCKELAIISPKFPKPILQVTHVHRCTEFPLTEATPPAEARDYFVRNFPDVLVSKDDLKTAPLQPMKGDPMKIHLKPDATPFALNTPRQIPYAFRDAVKDELQSMVDQGIIKQCGDEPSDWCHPMVVVPKPKGVRITTDLTKLNSQVARPVHSSMTPIAAVRTVDSSARYFTTADALHGYWQIELAEEDRHLTTFITPYGRYYYCRGPMGFAATGDAYCYRGDLALQGLTKCVKVVDDVLLFDDDLLSHYKRTQELLTRCRSHGITLNKDKFIVAANKVNFCGYTLSDKGIAADPDRVTALRDFPTPSNITDLRSFMGLVNQLAEFTPEIAKTAQPL